MNDPTEPFGLLAELAIALAGFSGVAAAFAGRDRSYQTLERIRLFSLFFSAGIVLAGSGAAYVLLLAGMAPVTAFRIVSVAAGLGVVVMSVPALVRSHRTAREAEPGATPWAVYVSVATVSLTSALLFGNGFFGTAHLLIAAFWIQLAHGLWIFSRVLTRTD